MYVYFLKKQNDLKPIRFFLKDHLFQFPLIHFPLQCAFIADFALNVLSGPIVSSQILQVTV